jgi:hypothetical protein
MKDYSKGKIYSIRSAHTDKVYIGSTTETLARRLAAHRSSYTSCQNGKRNYITSCELVQYPDCYIELVENFPCLCNEELGKREGEITRATPNYVNKRIEGRTPAEHYQDNKEKIGRIHKEYYVVNTEQIKKKQKEYRQNNGEQIAQHKNTKHECECGGKYSNSHKPKHIKTKKHQDWININ